MFQKSMYKEVNYENENVICKNNTKKISPCSVVYCLVKNHENRSL